MSGGLFYCYLNMEEVSGNLLSYAGEFPGVENKKWIGSKMCSYALLKEQGLQLGELRFPERKECGIRVEDGGWHFGYMGGHGEKDVKKRVAEKVRSAAHQMWRTELRMGRIFLGGMHHSNRLRLMGLFRSISGKIKQSMISLY